MAITITVNSIDKTDQIDWRSIRKSETLTTEPDTLTFLVKNYGSKTYQPAINDEVILYQGATKKFAGVVIESNESVDGLAKGLSVTCKGYRELLDRALVSKTYTSMTANAIISDLVSTFASGLGITTTNVNAPVTIDSIQFNYLTIAKCIEKIVSTLGAYDWYIDYNKDLHVFQSTSISAPYNLDDTSGNFAFQSLVITAKSDQIRNKITLRGGETASVSTRTEYFSGDATKTSFALANRYSAKPTVTVGGVSKTVGIDFVDLDSAFQVMWSADSQSLRFTSGNTPASGTNNVVVVGYPLYPIIIEKRDESSIVTYGLHEYLITDKTITSVQSALSRANAEIAKNGRPSSLARFKTYTDGLVAGQSMSITSTIRGVSQTYTIRNVTTTMFTPDSFQYEVQLESAPSIGIQEVLSRLLVTDPSNQVTVGENEVISRFYGFTETVGISDVVSQPTKTTGPYLYGSATWGFGIWNA